MLVLTRKLNEEIVIGDNIRITVVDVRGGRIRLGISAPTEVPIRRSEMAEFSAPVRVRKSAGTPRKSRFPLPVGCS